MIDYLTNKTYKAGAYLRLSIEDEKKDIESISITNQRAFIKDYALKNNIEIYDYYVDDGYSGGNFDRPGFRRLINDIENGVIDCVITKDMSRLGREFIETGNYVFKYFPEHNIRYIAILENYDTLNPNGTEDILPFKAVINDMYLKDISKKIKSVRHDMMAKGEFVSGSVPYGYKRSEENSKVLVIDDYAAPIVKRIFEMKNDGITNNMIARTLTNEGILPPDVYRGKNINKTITTNIWKACTVGHILQNECYIGTLTQGKYERVSLKSKKKRLLPKSKWVVRKNVLPKIISNDLFEKVNAPKRKEDTRFRQYDYLLKGLVVCADCGKTMTVRRVKNRHHPEIYTPIYVCRTYATYRNNVCTMHYYREEDLNELVLKEIRNVLSKYANNDKLEKQYESSMCSFDVLKEYETALNSCRDKVITIDKAISDLYKDKASGIISIDEFAGIKKELEKDRKENQEKIAYLEIAISESKNLFSDEKAKMKIINDFLKVKNPNKQMIRTLINKVEISEDKSIKIFFNFNVNEVNDGR